MNKIILALLLSLANVCASAASWPWQDSPAGAPGEYCLGFVVGGLASNHVSGMSRTDLWQSWSYLIRSGALEQRADVSEYKSGQEQFLNTPDAGAAESILEAAQGDCGLGRSGHQVTGW